MILLGCLNVEKNKNIMYKKPLDSASQLNFINDQYLIFYYSKQKMYLKCLIHKSSI